MTLASKPFWLDGCFTRESVKACPWTGESVAPLGQQREPDGEV